MSDTLREQIGERIRHARERAGLTQIQLARLINEEQPRISNYEAGRVLPSLERFYAMAWKAGLDPRVLLAPDDSEENS